MAFDRLHVPLLARRADRHALAPGMELEMQVRHLLPACRFAEPEQADGIGVPTSSKGSKLRHTYSFMPRGRRILSPQEVFKMFNGLCCKGSVRDVITTPNAEPTGGSRSSSRGSAAGPTVSTGQQTAETSDVFDQALRGRTRTPAESKKIVQAFAKHDIHIPEDIDPDLRKMMVSTRRVTLKIYSLNLSPANRALSPHRGDDDVYFRRITLKMSRDAHDNYLSELRAKVSDGELTEDEAQYAFTSAVGARMLYEGRMTKSFIIGANCGEHAAMGFVALARLPDNPALDVLNLVKDEGSTKKEPDHSFVLVNRDPKTDPTDYRTWNKDTIVMDTYARSNYLADKFYEKMVLAHPGFSHGNSKTELIAHHPANTEFALPYDISEFPDHPVPMPKPVAP